MARYSFEGKNYDFPDDVSQEEALQFIDSQHPQPQIQPQQTASTGAGSLAGISRIGAGAIADIANIGIGAANAVKSAGAWAGKELGIGNGEYTPIPEAGFGNSEFAKEYLTPHGTGEEIVASLPSYVLGGELVAPVKAAANAGRISRAATAVINQLPATIAGELSEHNQGDLSATDIAINSVLPPMVEKVGGAVVKGARYALPENLGGYSMAERVANVADKAKVAKVIQGGNEAAQQAFTTATTNAAGESTLLPSQMMNSQAGNKYIAAESRDMLRGENSVYNQRLAEQQSGEGIERAVTEANERPLFNQKEHQQNIDRFNELTDKMYNHPRGLTPGESIEMSELNRAIEQGESLKFAERNTLQESAQNITGQFKKQSSQLYQESKANAQSALDSLNVGEMDMQQTKNLALGHLEADAQAGRINLNGETRRMLNQLQNTKFDSIDTLDNWKRALGEKASKAYRNGDYKSSTTLREVLNSLRGEADATIQSIDPNIGSIYREADKYFSESVGDFGSGKKSVLGKIADKENPQTASNILVRGQNAEFNANQIGDALTGAINSGSLDDAARLATEFGSSLGATTRQTALDAATTGANFSPTKFANTLNRLDPQASVASKFSADEQAVNNALADAVSLTRRKASNASRITNAMATGAGRTVGGIVGGMAGSVVPVVGTLAGGFVGERLSKSIGEGLLDRIVGTNKRAMTYLDYLKDPNNAAKVLNITGEQPTEDAIKRAINVLTGSAGSRASLTPPATSQAPVVAPVASEEVPQHAQAGRLTMAEQPQSVQAKPSDFEPKITKLYKAFSHAETGGRSNRFIRTLAPEGNTVSTAYGPAQLTVNTMRDFYKQNPGLFNARERDYINRFIEQGQMMKHAAKDDPVFGYGGTGVLGGKEDRKLYADVVRKMLTKMVNDNGGSLEKTLREWRYGDRNADIDSRDPSYARKVREAFHNS